MNTFSAGQVLTLPYRDEKTMRVIVIDPNGQGEGRPTLGMGFGMTGETLGLPKSTLSRWTSESLGVASDLQNTPDALLGEGSSMLQGEESNSLFRGDQDASFKLLKSPSGNVYRVLQILDELGSSQLVIEGCDWVDLACDVLEKPGKVKQATLDKLNAFVRWLAKKGFYATTYAQMLGSYTKADDNLLSDRISELEGENFALKQELQALDCEYALLEHRYDRSLYMSGELKRDMAWHRMNSWGGADG